LRFVIAHDLLNRTVVQLILVRNRGSINVNQNISA